MNAVGIICEYNPFHNGHIYHINETKKLFPGYTLILVLNGYFLERGEISILSKENKTKLALIYGVDLVVELPFIYGTQSADIFADASIKILNALGCTDIVFGSESNNIKILEKAAITQETKDYNEKVKNYLNRGINYPTALAKALNITENIFNPNDLLGISYLKAINKNKYNIKAHTIKRTSNYHDVTSNDIIISASNIRKKFYNHENITKYTTKQTINKLENLNLNDLFLLIKYKIITCDNLSSYLTVDEGIEYRLKEKINEAKDIDDLIKLVKTKRYTYNKIARMLIHILVSVPKDINKEELKYIKILGFNEKGRKYLHHIKEDINISLIPLTDTLTYKYEILSALIYNLISHNDIMKYEKSNKPIYFE